MPELSSFVTLALKIEIVFFSEMLSSVYVTTQCQYPEHHHPHCRMNLKSLKVDGPLGFKRV
jgi:hypothetical protein